MMSTRRARPSAPRSFCRISKLREPTSNGFSTARCLISVGSDCLRAEDTRRPRRTSAIPVGPHDYRLCNDAATGLADAQETLADSPAHSPWPSARDDDGSGGLLA